MQRGGIGKALASVLLVLVCGAMAACGRGDAEKEAAKAKQKETQAKQPAPQPARIVHAVASDLFPAGAPINDQAPGIRALKSLVDWISSGEDVQADALVLVGDLGLSAPATAAAPPAKTAEAPKEGAADPTAKPDPPPPAATADTAARAKVIADVLATGSRSVPIYVVPGGKRLAAGANLKDTLTTLQSAVAAVVKALPAGSVTLIDLSLCYVAETPDLAQCTARVPDHQVKVVGYPAFAYPGTVAEPSLGEQKKWADAFQKAIPAQEEGWKTLVIAPLLSPVGDQWSDAAVRAGWLKAAGNAAAGIGIIAPSMVRQRYESGEPWTENGLIGRWFPTPPLITAAAGNHPIQGASVISVSTDSTDQQVFWYSAFRPGAASRSPHKKETWFSRWVRRPFAFLWRLGDLSPLARTALFAVAFLAAFLTAVAVWQIPPATSALATATVPAAPAAGAAGAAAGSATPPAAPTTTAAIQAVTTTTFLSGNFARTVLSGVGGLAIVTLILDELWTNSKPQAQGYYVVWFVFFFVMFLWMSSFFRGLIEGVRAVIVATSPVPVVGKGQNLWLTFTAWARRIGRRFWWFLVVAADTTFNVVQGRNDVKPFFLAETIVDLQLSALVTIDRVRESLTSAIEQLVKTKLPQAQLAAGDIRVSVSVLAEDENQAFYVSKPTQNLSTQFGPKSVAWVAVMIGQARWWVENKVYQDIELFDNTGQVIPLPHPAAKMLMKDYYQQRKADYEAFIVIPIPLRQRGTGVRRAGLHISFAKKAYMDAVWAKFADEPYGMPAANVPAPPPAAYPRANDILVETDAELRALLKQSIEVIESALRGFNEVLFWNEPRLHRRS